MNIYEYQKASLRTMNKGLTHTELMSMLSMGLTGESGETVDLLKKYLYHGHKLDVKKVEEELGDIMFYIANIATELGLSLEVIMEKNVEKLLKRYPKGFSSEDSIKRVDTKMKILRITRW